MGDYCRPIQIKNKPMNECIAFGEWLLVNYIPISGGWWKRENPVFGRAIPTSELYEIFKNKP